MKLKLQLEEAQVDYLYELLEFQLLDVNWEEVYPDKQERKKHTGDILTLMKLLNESLLVEKYNGLY